MQATRPSCSPDPESVPRPANHHAPFDARTPRNRPRLAPLRARAARGDADQDRGAPRAASGDGGVVHLRRAQGHRIHAGAARTQPGRTQGAAAADRGRREAPVQGVHHSDRREPGAVRGRARHLACHRARSVGGGAVLRLPGHRRHQCRAALHPRDDLARGIRRHHRRLVVELEVRPARRDALGRPDRRLRDCDGVRARGRADGRGQPQPARDRARAGGRLARLVLAASPCRCFSST